MAEQKQVKDKGGTMRLGAYACRVNKDTLSRKAYKKEKVMERHRHRFEFNNHFRKELEKKGLVVAGENPERKLVEIVELKGHPWFVGVQFHPEFQSRPLRPHPLFKEFVGASLKGRWEKDSV
jgi:CTP synthase